MRNISSIKLVAVSIIISVCTILSSHNAYAAAYTYCGTEMEEDRNPQLNSVVDQEFASIPLSIREKFISDGWGYAVIKKGEINRTYNQVAPGYYQDGVTDPNVKKIYIDGTPRSLGVLYHEIGHYIDDNVGCCNSSSEEFLRIFKNEGTTLGDYGATNNEEFFAEVVYSFFTDPEGTKEKCPYAYAYIYRVIRDFDKVSDARI